MYFSEWFGDTHSFSASKRTIPEANYRITNSDATKTLYIENDSKVTNAALVAGNNTVSSIFSFKKNTDSSYTIATNNNSGLVLTVPDPGCNIRLKLQQYLNT